MKRVIIIVALMLVALLAACTAKPDPYAWKVVTVDSSGDSSRLSWDKIAGSQNVKIVGTINELDFWIIRSCQTLYHLDLSEATVVGQITLSYKNANRPQIIQMGNAIPSGAFGEIIMTLSKPDTTISLAAHKTLRSIIFPKNITAIGRNAFAGCGLNRQLEIPKTVTQIYDSAFSNCGYLVGSLQLPENLTYLGSAAFAQCALLGGTLTIPSKLDSVAQFTFSNCSGFTELILPETLRKIGQNAFTTLAITSIDLPSMIDTIKANAFRNCRSLTGSLALPDNLRSIGDRAFQYCGFDGALTLNTLLRSIGTSAFDSTNFTWIEAQWTDAKSIPKWDVANNWFPKRFEVSNYTHQYVIYVPSGTLEIYQRHFAYQSAVFYNLEQRK